ncbi:MAG: hypothetical protein ACO1O6_10590 [Bacteroidota bacterium]
MKNVCIVSLFLALFSSCFGQHLGLSFQEAEKQGISVKKLDSLYRSALHADTLQAVFRTEQEQELMQQAYIRLLQDFGKFLSSGGFRWDKPTRCFNRIYFHADGTIDYFLFNFTGSETDKPSAEKQQEFQRLLNSFISDYRFPVTASTGFAQCSPTIYQPE